MRNECKTIFLMQKLSERAGRLYIFQSEAAAYFGEYH